MSIVELFQKNAKKEAKIEKMKTICYLCTKKLKKDA